MDKVGDFDRPVYVTSPPGDARLFVVEKTGRVRIVSGKAVAPEPFIDLSGQVSTGSEQGLLSIAFSPDYASDGLVYADFTDTDGDTHIVEFKVDARNPDRLDPATRREVIKIDQPFSNHNGGLLLFDRSGMLIVGLGDGGSANDPGNRAQDLSELLGKLLRIDPRHRTGNEAYAIPDDNPKTSGGRREILTYGMRNPWRFSFDRDGTLWVGDVGQNRFEEIDRVPAARLHDLTNFGWRAYEGNQRATEERIDETHLVRPVHTYPTARGRCAVTGGYVYRGRVTALRGFYVFGDFCDGQVRGLNLADTAAEPVVFNGLRTTSLASFGEDSRGELYVVSLDGPVYRVTAG